MGQMHQITIHENTTRNGMRLEELSKKLFKYMGRKKAEEPKIVEDEDGVVTKAHYILRNGLEVNYSKNGTGIAQLTVIGDFERFKKSVDVLLGMYLGTMVVKYNA